MNEDKDTEVSSNNVDVNYAAIFECTLLGIDVTHDGKPTRAYYDPNNANHLCFVDNSKRRRNEHELTKILVRNLPPEMTEDEFLSLISPLPEHDYFRFLSGGSFNPFSRAYINFLNSSDIAEFALRMTEFIFVDVKGEEYQAIVDYAPYQRITKTRTNRKKDPLCGTLSSDPDYMAFEQEFAAMAERTNNTQQSDTVFDLTASSDSEDERLTPLIEHLREHNTKFNKFKQNKRPERRRNEYERKWIKEETKRFRKEKERKHHGYEFSENNGRNTSKWKDRKPSNFLTSKGKYGKASVEYNKSSKTTTTTRKMKDDTNENVQAKMATKKPSSNEDVEKADKQLITASVLPDEKLIENVKKNESENNSEDVAAAGENQNDEQDEEKEEDPSVAISGTETAASSSLKRVCRKVVRIPINTGNWKYINIIRKLRTGILYTAKHRIKKICLQKVKRKLIHRQMSMAARPNDDYQEESYSSFEYDENERSLFSPFEHDDDDDDTSTLIEASDEDYPFDNSKATSRRNSSSDLVEDDSMMMNDLSYEMNRMFSLLAEQETTCRIDETIETAGILLTTTTTTISELSDKEAESDNDIQNICHDIIEDLIDAALVLVKNDGDDTDRIQQCQHLGEQSSSSFSNFIGSEMDDVTINNEGQQRASNMQDLKHIDAADESCSNTIEVLTKRDIDSEKSSNQNDQDVAILEEISNTNDLEDGQISEPMLEPENFVNCNDFISSNSELPPTLSVNDRRMSSKDRPSLEIYRPGMGTYAKFRLQQNQTEPVE